MANGARPPTGHIQTDLLMTVCATDPDPQVDATDRYSPSVELRRVLPLRRRARSRRVRAQQARRHVRLSTACPCSQPVSLPSSLRRSTAYLPPSAEDQPLHRDPTVAGSRRFTFLLHCPPRSPGGPIRYGRSYQKLRPGRRSDATPSLSIPIEQPLCSATVGLEAGVAHRLCLPHALQQSEVTAASRVDSSTAFRCAAASTIDIPPAIFSPSNDAARSADAFRLARPAHP